MQFAIHPLLMTMSPSNRPTLLVALLVATSSAFEARSPSLSRIPRPRIARYPPVEGRALSTPSADTTLQPLAALRTIALRRTRPVSVPCGVDADGCIAVCDDFAQSCSVLATASAWRRVKVGACFALWFALSVSYSLVNKRVNNLLVGVPCSVATFTVAVGSGCYNQGSGQGRDGLAKLELFQRGEPGFS